MNSGIVSVGDIKMYYQMTGQGEPVLMIMDQAAGPLTIKQMADDAAGLMDALGIRIERLLLGAAAAGGPSRVYHPPEIEKYFTPRTDLSAHDYLLWTAEACYPREFLDAHPDIHDRHEGCSHSAPKQLCYRQGDCRCPVAPNKWSRAHLLDQPSPGNSGDN